MQKGEEEKGKVNAREEEGDRVREETSR